MCLRPARVLACPVYASVSDAFVCLIPGPHTIQTHTWEADLPSSMPMAVKNSPMPAGAMMAWSRNVLTSAVTGWPIALGKMNCCCGGVVGRGKGECFGEGTGASGQRVCWTSDDPACQPPNLP